MQIFVLFLVLCAIAVADRVYYYDLPTQDTTSIWAAGSAVNFVMCWAKGMKWPHNMAKSEWKILLSRPFGKTREIEPSFRPFQSIIPKDSDSFYGTAKGRSFYGGKDEAPKCNIVTITIPEDAPTSANWRIRLVRVRHGWFDRKYEKSRRLYIEGKKKKSGQLYNPQLYAPYIDSFKAQQETGADMEDQQAPLDPPVYSRESGATQSAFSN